MISDRIAFQIKDAATFSGLTRSEIYRRLASRELAAVKNGKRTLVLADSLRAFIASLPAATFGVSPPETV